MTKTKWIASGALLLASIAAVIGTAPVKADHHEPSKSDAATETADRLAMLQVIAEYSYTFDSRDSEGWAKLFTEDAVWQYVGAQSAEPLTDLNGRDEILAWAKQRHKDIPQNITSYHHQSGVAFEALTADTARTRVMVIITAHDNTQAGAAINITLTGVYHDEWRKTSEGWRFSKRVLKG